MVKRIPPDLMQAILQIHPRKKKTHWELGAATPLVHSMANFEWRKSPNMSVWPNIFAQHAQVGKRHNNKA